MAETIERSSDRYRFWNVDIRAKVRESKKFWASPAGKKRRAELDREARNRKRIPPKYPELARRSGTKPAIAPLEEVKDWAARLGTPTR